MSIARQDALPDESDPISTLPSVPRRDLQDLPKPLIDLHQGVTPHPDEPISSTHQLLALRQQHAVPPHRTNISRGGELRLPEGK